MSYGTLPTMTVIRNGKALRINVTDYNPESDTMPETDAPVVVQSAAHADIPVDWESLAWPQLRALAQRVKGGPVQGRADAVAVIQQVLKG